MEWWQGLVLGLVQGLTEFIPVSSTAHLRIVPALLGWPDPGTAFSAVIQLGTLVAVLAYFQADIRALIAGAIRFFYTKDPEQLRQGRMAWTIAAGNLPIIVLGLSFKSYIETQGRSLYLIGAMLILVALALAWVEYRIPEGSRWEELTFWRAQLVGLFQALALIPGASRSGSTILGGLLVGLRRSDAARFSFLLGIPAILGSGLLELKELWQGWDQGQGGQTALLVGLLAALVSGYVSIGFLLRFLTRYTTRLFVVYRLVVGAAIILLALAGVVR